MLEDVVHQFLHDAEDDEFLFGLDPVLVIMKTGAGIYGSAPADLLEKVVDRRFQSEILEGGWHQAVADVADELDGIIDDLACLEYALELRGLVLVHEVFIEIEPGGGEEGTGIIMEVGGQSLSFLFLQLDAGVEHHLLLVYFHLLHSLLEALHPALVEDDEEHQANHQYQHSDGAQKKHQAGIGGIGLQEKHE